MSRKIRNAPRAFCTWAELEWLSGNHEKAESALQEHFSINTDSPRGYILRARMLIQKGNEPSALAMLKRAESLLRVAKNEKKANIHTQLSEAIFFTGEVDWQEGRRSMAVGRWQKAIETDPTLPYGSSSFGELAIQNADGKYANQIFQELVAHFPENPSFLFHLGVARRLLGDIEGAEMAYQKAVGIDPGLAEAHLALGVIHHKFRSDPKGR